MVTYHPPSPELVEGSSFLEVIAVVTVIPSSLWIVTCVLSSFRLTSSLTGSARLAVECAFVFLPFIFLCTLIGDYFILNLSTPIGLLILGFYILNRNGEAYMVPKWTEFLLISRPGNFTLKIDDVSQRCNFNLITATCIGILAVDFEFFPSKFTKCNLYGFSVMDVGIGCFVAINALISSEARKSQPISQRLPMIPAILHLMRRDSPLLVVGAMRTAFISISGYNQNVTEYGVHWNSFFTIALVRMISSVIHRFAKGSRGVIVAVTLVTFHQLFLMHGGSDFIRSSDRSNLLAANKEGILSLPGFVSIYILSLELGSRWFRMFTLSTKSILHVLRLMEASVIAMVSLVITLISHHLIEPNSRRQANLSYVSWSIFIMSYSFALESAMKLLTEFTVSLGLMPQQKAQNSPQIIKSFMWRPFLLFMLANIFTGLINIFYSISSASLIICICILYFYMYSLTLIGDNLLNSRLRDKLKSITNFTRWAKCK